MDTTRHNQPSPPPPAYTAIGIHHATNPQLVNGIHMNSEPSSLDYTVAAAAAATANDEDDVDPTTTDPPPAPVANMCTGITTLAIGYNVLVHLVLYGYTIYLSWISFVNKDPYSIFCWHSPLMLLGYSILMTESMLCFSNTNLLTHRLNHRSRVYLHWILQLAAAFCIFAGLMAAVIRKLYRGKTHFKTYHALFGIVAIALSAATMMNGVPTKYAMRLRRFVRPVLMKISHSVLALIAYVVAVVATLLGLYSSTYVTYSHGDQTVFYAMWVMIVFSSQYMVYGPVANLWGRVAGIVRRRRMERSGAEQL